MAHEIKRNYVDYYVEYTPNENEGKQWEQLTEDQFVRLCNEHKAKLRGIEWESNIYYAHLTGPTVVIIDKHGLFYS